HGVHPLSLAGQKVGKPTHQPRARSDLQNARIQSLRVPGGENRRRADQTGHDESMARNLLENMMKLVPFREAYLSNAASVAQSCTLLYRRFVIRPLRQAPVCPVSPTVCRLQVGNTADWKSALQLGRAEVLFRFSDTGPT